MPRARAGHAWTNNPKPKASAPSSVETASPSAASDAAKAQQDTQATVEISEIEPLDTQATPAAAAIAAAPVEDADIEIRASRRTWMRIESAQGQVLFSSIIRQGEGFKLESPDGYTLATRDAGALEFFVNDNAVGAVGRRGQILTARKIERAAIFAKSR